MATNITEYNATAGSNTSIDSINLQENQMVASDVNNAIRSLMSHLKNVDTGSQALTALSVTGALSCGAFTSNGIDDNADATAITIDSSERVGIGTSSPSVPFHVNGGTDNIVAKFESSDADALIEFADNATSDTILLGADTDDLLFRCDPGNIIFKTNNNTEAMRIDNNGNLLVGTTSSTGNGGVFQVKRTDAGACGYFETNAGSSQNIVDIVQAANVGASQALRFHNNGYGNIVGSIGFNTSSTSFNTSSDYRLKENFVTNFDATSRLKQLKPTRFNFIGSDLTQDGFLAHEVSNIVPEAITGEKDAMQIETRYTEDDKETQGDNPTKKVGDAKTYSKTKIDPQGIDQSKLVPLLVKTIQELEARITALENA